MKFSENWLREWVNIPVDQKELIHRLTMAGLEVESIQPLGDYLDGVVVGHIIHIEPHPNADRLRVCKVEIDNKKTLQIVCGAANARMGLKAPLAMIGARLPNGLLIKAATMRGVDSHGMLCSTKELGLAEESNGLMELPDDAPSGAPLASYLGLPDASIEIKLTPNRADCLGIRGLAFDAAAIFNTTINEPDLNPVTAQIEEQVAIRIDTPAECPRYVGRVIRDINSSAVTPLWMAERLRRAGLRPISPVVDVTNYVMLELGQPLHAFDHDQLRNPVTVRRATEEEKLTLLTGNAVSLSPEFLVIADEKQAIALAGVMGGQDSCVTTSTKNIFLESAHFIPSSIMGKARKLGLHTDASHRFERGVDPELPQLAIERATALLLDIVGGKPGPVVEESSPQYLLGQHSIVLRRQRLQRVLGISLDDESVKQIFLHLGMRVENIAEGWRITPPSRRFDIDIEEDLIEEIARIYGYDRIPVQAPRGQLHLSIPSETQLSLDRVRECLLNRGYFEAINYSFVAPDWLDRWHLTENSVPLANPLSNDLAIMRTSLLPALVEALRYNRHRQQDRVRLFEIGRVFHSAQDKAAPREMLQVAAVACGSTLPESWANTARQMDFFDLKGDLEQLLLMTDDLRTREFRTNEMPAFLHPGQSAEIWYQNKRIGYLGSLHSRLCKQLDLEEKVYIFEVNYSQLSSTVLPHAQELPRFPSVRRDIAVIVSQNLPYFQIETVIREAGEPRLTSCFIFDQYVGPGLGNDVKSLAIGLVLQDNERTLTDQDADCQVAAIVAALEQKCNAKLRG